jgi:hypothetical protein
VRWVTENRWGITESFELRKYRYQRRSGVRRFIAVQMT